MKENQKFYPVILTLRGIASLAVCLFHFVFTTRDFFIHEGVVNLFQYGIKGVQLFFILSGVVIPLFLIEKNYEIKYFTSFLWRRIIRIEPPYLAACLIAIGYLYLRTFIPSSKEVNLIPNAKELLLHLAYLIPFAENAHWVNPVFWTLAIEFQYYIFLAIAFPLILFNKLWKRIIFYACLLLPGLIFREPSFFPFWGAYFAIGIIYVLFHLHKIKFIEFTTLLLICIYINWGLHDYDSIDFIIAFFTIFIIHYLPNFKSRIGLFLGKISYSLYLIHIPIGGAIINFLAHYSHNDLERILVVFIGLGLSILFSYLFWMLIEEPFHKRSKKIGFTSI